VNNNIVKKWYHSIIEPQIKESWIYKNFKLFLAGAAVVLIVGGGLWGYRYWMRYKEEAAQKAFSEGLYAYEEALHSKDPLWTNAEFIFNEGYKRYPTSRLAPYFLVFSSDVLLKQGKRQEAIDTLDKAIGLLPVDSPLIYLYKTKRVLIQLDDENQDVKKAALQVLVDLGYDEKNENRDMALYYIGLYHWSGNEMKEAQKVWEQLVESYKHEKLGASPWVSLAKIKLEQIV